MGGVRGMRPGVFAGFLGVVIAAAATQSVLHLDAVLAHEHIGSMVDLDRSNGLPDALSAAALAMAAVGAARLTRLSRSPVRGLAASLAVVLTGVTIADVVHDGPHPGSVIGWLVTALVVVAVVQLAALGRASSLRAMITLCVAGSCLLASFLVTTLVHVDAARFERARGDPIAEYQIVVKEGLELLGWSLVALALWDELLRRRRAPEQIVRSPASRGRAPSRRRAA